MFRKGDIDGVIIREANLFKDVRGWLAEVFRADDLPEGFSPLMSYVSMTLPGVARGPHEHSYQSDYFYFLSNFKLYLWDNRKSSSTYLNMLVMDETRGKAVIIPPGVVHAYKNDTTSDGLVLNFPDKLYAGWGKKEPVDEIRHESDKESPFTLD